jgi:glycogen debranching enzyme
LNEEHYRPAFDAVTQQLVTPYGLRTLAPNDAGYCGHLKENVEEQQEGLHQGTVWSWLIGPYAEALLRMENITSSSNAKQTSETILHQEYVWRRGIQLLDVFRTQLQTGVLGMVGGVFDGDAPHNAGYAVASALSTGEILRVYNLLARISIRHLVSAIPI